VALRYAREHSPALLAAREDIQAAQGTEVTAGLRPNPIFNLNSESYALFEPSPGNFLNRQELTMTIEQPIETGRKRYWRHRVASAAREFVESQADDMERLVKLRVEQTYSQVLLAQADLDSARQVLADYDRIVAINKARFEKGAISGGEFRRIEIERLRFLDDVIVSESNLRNAKVALLTEIGYPDVQRDFETSGSLDVRPVEESVEQLSEEALRYRPDLAAQRFRDRQAQNELSLQKANAVPNISPFVGYKRDFGLNTLAFGIRLPLQVFNRNQGEIARAAAERRSQDFRLLINERRIREGVAQAYNNFRAQERRLREIQDFYLQRARESRDITEESYRLGGIDLLVLLDVQRSYREVVRTFNRARYGAVVGRFQLEAAVGKEL
jgi:cobalt-zinc-cadmium efflux system outer membrane protein